MRTLVTRYANSVRIETLPIVFHSLDFAKAVALANLEGFIVGVNKAGKIEVVNLYQFAGLERVGDYFNYKGHY